MPMKVIVEKIQRSLLTVEVSANENAINKARANEGVLGVQLQEPIYAVRSQESLQPRQRLTIVRQATSKLQVARKEAPIQPQPWPLVLRPMKLLARPGDKGLGDIVERVIGPVGGDAYKKWYVLTFGVPCGCTKRQDQLNERYPL